MNVITNWFWLQTKSKFPVSFNENKAGFFWNISHLLTKKKYEKEESRVQYEERRHWPGLRWLLTSGMGDKKVGGEIIVWSESLLPQEHWGHPGVSALLCFLSVGLILTKKKKKSVLRCWRQSYLYHEYFEQNHCFWVWQGPLRRVHSSGSWCTRWLDLGFK